MREIQINLIEGYEDVKDQYWINELGEVININTQKKLIPCADGRGYPQYKIMGKTKKYIAVKIHKILAKWLIPNPNNYIMVRHLDDNKFNWKLENLAWGTRADNEHDKKINSGSYSGAASFRGKPVICIETGIKYNSACEAQKITSISRTSISNCCLGKQETAGNFHWKFVGGK